MICLTGDVHHDQLATNEQLWLERQGRRISEVAMSVRYTRLCEEYGVKCTLYTTGRTLADQWEEFAPIAASPLIEVGGHTFEGLPRPAFSRLRAWLGGTVSVSHANSHGSYKAQQRDVRRMMDTARRRLGRDIVSWRSHGLVRDDNTDDILYKAGIRYISDELNWERLRPNRLPGGLISHPLNVIMDHDHIYHAHRDEDYVRRQQSNWGYVTDPTRESYDIDAWANLVERQVATIEEQNGVATVLLHPLCMYSADEFKTMRRLLKFFSQYSTIWACETGQYVE